MNKFRSAVLSLAITTLVFSCGGGGTNRGGTGGGGGGGGSGGGTTPDVPGSEETVVIGEAGLCSSGDVARVDVDGSGRARFALVNDDVSCSASKDNREEEYTLIVYNTTTANMSFTINSPLQESPPSTKVKALQYGKTELLQDFVETKVPAQNNLKPTGPNVTAKVASELIQSHKPKAWEYGKAPHTKNRFLNAEALTVGDEYEFRVRNNVDDKNSYATTSAILRGQGAHINVFVDRDAPFNTSSPDALTTANMTEIVNVYENNIYPLVTGLLGSTSDVDGDGRVSLVISPLLNRWLDCPIGGYTASYTDARNVLPYNPVSNPLSNEGEIIFAFAPDSMGNYRNSIFGVTPSVYLNRIKAWLAFQLTHLISYNSHVLQSESGQAEDDWIDDGLGAVMADFAGFNIFAEGMRRLHLNQAQFATLTGASDLDCGVAAPYDFMLYYVYSQLNDSNEDTNGNGFDDNLEFVSKLMTSDLTGEENIENAVDFSFNADVETEFQAIFKDWLIAIATSGSNRTDLQQNDQTAVKYFYNLNPTHLGSEIGDSDGSVRFGAIGNDIGVDMNGFNTYGGASFLVENADEHVYVPGNVFHGYVAPYAAMFVRVTGLFQQKQTLAFKGSSSSIRGFLVRRSNVSYPHAYSESILGSIDQHPEDTDEPGPNPYWTDQGFAKKIDLDSLVGSASLNSYSQDFLSIVGEIDAPQKISVCPEDLTNCELTEVPDTDKYLITVPDLARGDEGQLEFVIRRKHDDSAPTSGLDPALTIVSSKDVPYPYVPHPIRNSVNGSGTTDTRQPYRWMTTQLICGDDQASGVTGLNNSEGGVCTPQGDEDSEKIAFEGSVENTGYLLAGGLEWDGDILGGECDSEPTEPSQVKTALDGGYGSNGSYPVTDIERSGSPLGGYGWSEFMTESYRGADFPDKLFGREFMKSETTYPSTDPDSYYDPRNSNSLTLNCHVTTTGDPDTAPDSPDDILEPGELTTPGSLTEQILVEMARFRYASGTDPLLNSPDEGANLDPKYDDYDVLAANRDSRDNENGCVLYSWTYNLNTLTVESGDGAYLSAANSGGSVKDTLEPHVANRKGSSAIVDPLNDQGQLIYNPPPVSYLSLTPGKSYTLIVSGLGGSVGDYELRIRKTGVGSASAYELQSGACSN